ncbi:MAG TPA: cyclohexa-1,5-dienecarbonyl-CoA hydratase [Burkholderiales bacterium]|nr:cyclohexa-1,5-dienecarbonyl-CoA hydratase [Burkholderiales bacterium]
MTASPTHGLAASGPVETWLDRDEALLRLRLDRPKANIIDSEMIASLSQALAAYTEPGPVRAAVLDSEGPHFSFGASVEEHLPEKCAEMLSSFHDLMRVMLEWPRPILVVVRGQCLGGGLELALAGSLIFASRDAKLGQPEIKLGVFAPAASCLLPLRIGQGAAEDLLFSGRSVDATEAKALGLVHAVADDPEAAALAYFDTHLATKSASSLAWAVDAVRESFVPQVERRIAHVERVYLNHLMQTRDAKEGLEAFIAKRSPRWEHR